MEVLLLKLPALLAGVALFVSGNLLFISGFTGPVNIESSRVRNGVLVVEGTANTENGMASFTLEVEEESKDGIDDGPVTKLTVTYKKNGATIKWDRKWISEPSVEAEWKLVKKIIEESTKESLYDRFIKTIKKKRR